MLNNRGEFLHPAGAIGIDNFPGGHAVKGKIFNGMHEFDGFADCRYHHSPPAGTMALGRNTEHAPGDGIASTEIIEQPGRNRGLTQEGLNRSNCSHKQRIGFGESTYLSTAKIVIFTLSGDKNLTGLYLFKIY